MIDLIYLAHNRLEFTKASLDALIRNTNWNHVDRFHVYDDDSSDGTREYLEEWAAKVWSSATLRRLPLELHLRKLGHPVNVMRNYLTEHSRHSIFGKIDSDTMVPPGWLEACLNVMEANPDLDLLGIEAFNEVEAGAAQYGYREARFIGGIGLMRRLAFTTLPAANGRYFGFTEWQERNPQVKKGWINPSLPVFLLDRFPFEPWRSLSKQYMERFGQRDHGPYLETSTELWDWWRQ